MSAPKPSEAQLDEIINGTKTADQIVTALNGGLGETDEKATRAQVDAAVEGRRRKLQENLIEALRKENAGEVRPKDQRAEAKELRKKRRAAALEMMLGADDARAEQLAKDIQESVATVRGWRSVRTAGATKPTSYAPLPPTWMGETLYQVRLEQSTAADVVSTLKSRGSGVPRISKLTEEDVEDLVERFNSGLRLLASLRLPATGGALRSAMEDVGSLLMDEPFVSSTATTSDRRKEESRFQSLLPPEWLLRQVREVSAKRAVAADLAKSEWQFRIDDLGPHALRQESVSAMVSVIAANPMQGIRPGPSPTTYPTVDAQSVCFGELELTWAGAFEYRWGDMGSGADWDGGFHHPVAPVGFKALASVCRVHHNRPILPWMAREWAICVKPSPLADPRYPPLALPHDYAIIWRDNGSGADLDGACWRPIPPPGYVALGDVFVRGWGAPPMMDTWCVRRDLVSEGWINDEFGGVRGRGWPDAQNTGRGWQDNGSGADADFGAWYIDAPQGLAPDSEPLDMGLIAIGGFVAVTDNDHHPRTHPLAESRWKPVTWVLRLPFPREDYVVLPGVDKWQLFRRVWVPACAVDHHMATGYMPPMNRPNSFVVEVWVGWNAAAHPRSGDQSVWLPTGPAHDLYHDPSLGDQSGRIALPADRRGAFPAKPWTRFVRLPRSLTRLAHPDEGATPRAWTTKETRATFRLRIMKPGESHDHQAVYRGPVVDPAAELIRNRR